MSLRSAIRVGAFAVTCTAAWGEPAAVVEELAKALPGFSAVEVVEHAAAHLAAPLGDLYCEHVWWDLTFQRWYETDREGAGAFALANRGSSGDRLAQLLRVARRLEGDDTVVADYAESIGGRAPALLDAVFGEQPKEEAAAPAATAAAQVLRTAVVQALSRRSGDQDRIGALAEEFGPLVERDLVAAVELAVEAGRTTADQHDLVAALCQELAGGDPEAVASLFDQIPRGEARVSLAAHIASKWAARKDPAAALGWAEGLRPGPERDAALLGVARGQAHENPTAVLDILEKHGWRIGLDGATADLSRAFVHLVSDGRASEALARAALIPDGDVQSWVLRESIQAWFAAAPTEAFDWITEAPSDVPTEWWWINDGLKAVGARGDLDTVTGLLGRVEDPDRLESLVYFFTEEVAGVNTGEVVGALTGWAGGLPVDTRTRVHSAVVRGLTNIQPAAAAELLAGVNAGGALDGSWGRVTQSWAKTDPEAAAVYVQNNSGTLPPGAFRGLVRGWVETSPHEASGWVAALPPDRQRDGAIDELVWHLTRGAGVPDFEAALAWAAQISTADHRENTVGSVLSEWHAADPGAAPPTR